MQGLVVVLGSHLEKEDEEEDGGHAEEEGDETAAQDHDDEAALYPLNQPAPDLVPDVVFDPTPDVVLDLHPTEPTVPTFEIKPAPKPPPAQDDEVFALNVAALSEDLVHFDVRTAQQLVDELMSADADVEFRHVAGSSHLAECAALFTNGRAAGTLMRQDADGNKLEDGDGNYIGHGDEGTHDHAEEEEYDCGDGDAGRGSS